MLRDYLCQIHPPCSNQLLLRREPARVYRLLHEIEDLRVQCGAVRHFSIRRQQLIPPPVRPGLVEIKFKRDSMDFSLLEGAMASKSYGKIADICDDLMLHASISQNFFLNSSLFVVSL
ncbi:hypothetical protein AAC387_Pa04g1615 [Persea americana]